MKRRCIAVVGMIALAFAYLPGVVSVLSANASFTCCAGMLCPMHHMGGQDLRHGPGSSRYNVRSMRL